MVRLCCDCHGRSASWRLAIEQPCGESPLAQPEGLHLHGFGVLQWGHSQNQNQHSKPWGLREQMLSTFHFKMFTILGQNIFLTVFSFKDRSHGQMGHRTQRCWAAPQQWWHMYSKDPPGLPSMSTGLPVLSTLPEADPWGCALLVSFVLQVSGGLCPVCRLSVACFNAYILTKQDKSFFFFLTFITYTTQ